MEPSASATVDDKFEAVPGNSYLAMLRCPQLATIARKRKVAINPPPRGKVKKTAWYQLLVHAWPFPPYFRKIVTLT